VAFYTGDRLGLVDKVRVSGRPRRDPGERLGSELLLLHVVRAGADAGLAGGGDLGAGRAARRARRARRASSRAVAAVGPLVLVQRQPLLAVVRLQGAALEDATLLARLRRRVAGRAAAGLRGGARQPAVGVVGTAVRAAVRGGAPRRPFPHAQRRLHALGRLHAQRPVRHLINTRSTSFIQHSTKSQLHFYTLNPDL